MHSAQFYVIISDELNRKQQVPSAALRGGKGKREAGADPARSRHCDKGVRVRVLCAPATGALLREGDAGRRSFSQETCLLLVLGPEPQITRNWLYQKALKQQRSFCHAIRRTEGPLFSSLFPVPFVWFKPQFIQQERTRTMRKIETKKLAAAVTALALCVGVLTGCGGAASSTASSTAASSASSEASSEEADEMAAKNVADLIDAIYVQERNDDTDAQCEAAKAAWDALTDTQKELVEGENADPDYFGRDTGDASKDDARNQDDIGDNELLVVSFGTSFNDSRVKDIKGIEDALQAAYPDWSVRRAFTAQIIINHVQARDGEKIDNMQQAMDRAVENGVKNLVVQPTHLMHGAEYDEMMEMIDTYRDKFESVAVAEPLLGEVGSDATIINQDNEDVAKAVTAAAVKEAGYDSLDAVAADKVAFVFMGHGTSHTAKVSYSQMQTTMQTLGYDNVFIGTVEGKPEETACENVIEAVKAAGYTKVILRPLMVVAGDHANNDMAGEDADSWLSQFKASGAFDSIDCQIAGLGEIEDVQKLYVAHTKAAIDSLNG